MTDPASLPPLLLPRAREARWAERGVVHATPRDSSVAPAERVAGGAEWYRLTIGGSSGAPVRIEAGGDAGERHARRTLAQLHAQYGERLPRGVVEDEPAFSTRGVMLDVSRDRVPTMEHLLATVELLASLKFNHLQLYTEHTFAYRGHEEVWRDASPMTPAEVRELDTFCRARGVELAANQNCFGHLASWLRRERYAGLAETHGEWVFENGDQRFPRRGPFSLCPTDPASLAFVEDLLGQLLPCFSSGLVNIGCDETFDVGYGRSREEVERRGRAAVYAEFVNSVAAAARRHGKRPMLWADIALTHPECLRDLPEDLIGLAWGYEPGEKWERWCGLLRGAGREAWVCPGTSSWRSITGRTSERRANMLEAARAGAAAGATGYLITDWGDSGHHQQWPVSLAALAEAADAAWTGGREGYDPRAASLHAFGDRTLGVAGWLDELGDADRALRAAAGVRNSSALFVDLHAPLAPTAPDARAQRVLDTPARMWIEARDRLRELSRSAAWHGVPALHAELSHTVSEAIVASVKGIARRTGDLSAASRRTLADMVGAVRDDHRRLWPLRSRPGGLGASCNHYERIIEDLRGGSGETGGKG